MLGVEGLELAIPKELFEKTQSGGVNKDRILFPGVQINSNEFNADIELKDIFDMMWNAFGYSHSYNYDEQGNRIPRR